MALLLLLALLPIAMILVDAADNNPVFNPCRQLLPVGGKDSISIAVGYTGAPSVWYNNSDPSLNQLSPCDNALVAKMPANSRVAVFRPLLDQISMLRTNNASYLDLHTAVIYQTSTIEEHISWECYCGCVCWEPHNCLDSKILPHSLRENTDLHARD